MNLVRSTLIFRIKCDRRARLLPSHEQFRVLKTNRSGWSLASHARRLWQHSQLECRKREGFMSDWNRPLLRHVERPRFLVHARQMKSSNGNRCLETKQSQTQTRLLVGWASLLRNDAARMVSNVSELNEHSWVLPSLSLEKQGQALLIDFSPTALMRLSHGAGMSVASFLHRPAPDTPQTCGFKLRFLIATSSDDELTRC